MPSPFEAALAARLVPAEVDVFTPLDYKPHDRQQIFHTMSRQRVNAILYGGAAGGGKSAALLMESIYCAVNFSGMRIGCIRRTYNELEESFLAELTKRQYAKAVGGRWNNTAKTLKFPNGSIINFTYAENEIDASRLLGGEYQLFCIDEASQMPAPVIQHVEERLRSGRRGLPVIGLRLATNPGGISHTYLKNRFVKATTYGQVDRKTGLPCIVLGKKIDPNTGIPLTEPPKHPRTIAYIPAKVDDNPYIDQDYEGVLDDIPDPQRRKAMRDGDWDAQVGQFFEQWNREKHIVPPFDAADPYKLPETWLRFAGIDYGWRAPYAVVWAACDNDGRLWIYREICARFIDAKDQAALILEAEEKSGDRDVIRVADPSMWGNRGTPLTIADIYGMEGCGIAQADNDRLNGWARVHHYLNDGPPCEYHRELGWIKCPMLHVFDGNCPNFIEDIPALPRSQTKPDDAETRNVADHIPDALRYMCMAVNTHARPVFYDNPPPSSQEIHRLRQEEQQAFNPHQTRVTDLYAAPDLAMRI